MSVTWAVLVGPELDSDGSATEVASAVPGVPEFGALLEPGDVSTLDAVDAAGKWGEIRLERGEDVGGYTTGSVSQDTFVVEVRVVYSAERYPDPSLFGGPDWALATPGDMLPVGRQMSKGVPPDGARQIIGGLPGAIEIMGDPIGGWLLFEVPRDLADEDLVLVYQPAALDEVVGLAPVRSGGPPPDHIASATIGPTPQPQRYVAKERYPFTVIDSPEADELFATSDTCENPDAGYTVTYPDVWFTNTEVAGWDPCTWFSPVFYEVGEDPRQVPPEIAIVLNFDAVVYGYVSEPLRTVSDQLESGGWPAYRAEEYGVRHLSGLVEEFPPLYFYVVDFSEPAHGSLTLRAQTQSKAAADYALNKAVLDRIMALIQFEE